MAKDPQSDFLAVSEEMRKFTKASVEQARSAFNDFMHATSSAMDDAQTKSRSLTDDARNLGLGSVAYAQNSIEASFAFAARMAQAKDVNEVMELQKSYLEEQFKAAQSEMQRITETASKLAEDLASKK